jgi:hypothetical protein
MVGSQARSCRLVVCSLGALSPGLVASLLSSLRVLESQFVDEKGLHQVPKVATR